MVHINVLYGPGGVVLTAELVNRDKGKEKDKATVDFTSARSSIPKTPSKDRQAPTPSTPTSERRKRPNNTGDVIDLDKEDDVAITGAKRPRMGGAPAASLQVGNVQGNFSMHNRMPGSPRSPRGVSRHFCILKFHRNWLVVTCLQ